ncbi:MAG: acyl-CoA synthetase, partial [Halioglobus sp.]|nr:acyl-CoA synthetase [Halioglobus sp.]
PDEQWGEAVKAVVVLKPDFEGNDELVASMQALVKKAKGSVQSPKSIDFVPGIPLTPVGKPDKKAVRAQYWADSDRGVG